VLPGGLSHEPSYSEKPLVAADAKTAIAERAAAAAGEVVGLAGHTKIGTKALLQTVAPEDIRHLVTDDQADPEELAALRARPASRSTSRRATAEQRTRACSS
jgi:DeoR/GlpR family transcriptional regulator of sugar metabolism